MSTPWMIRRRVGWYLRLRIPADLAPLIGSHLVRSLKTNDRRMAQARAARAVAASEAAWQEARTMMHTWMGVPTPQVDTEAIDAAISDWPRAEREYDGLPP